MDYKKFIKNTFLYEYLHHIYHVIFSPIITYKIVQDFFYTKKVIKNNWLNKNLNKNQNKRLAIVAFNGVLINTKIEATLARFLEDNGYRIDVLLRDNGNPWTIKYYNIFGIKNFINLSKIKICNAKKNNIKEYLKSIDFNALNFKFLKSLKFEGITIGPTLLSNIQRVNRLGSPDLSNPEIICQLQNKLPEILEWIYKIQLFFEKNKFDKLLLVEANDWNKPIVEISILEGIDVIQMVQPFEDNGLVFKRINSKTIGINPNSVSKETLKKELNNGENECSEEIDKILHRRYSGELKLQKRNQHNTHKYNNQELLSFLDFQNDKKIACIFSHILWDANLFYGDDIYQDYSDWFIKTIQIAIKNNNINWIVKLHPANVWKRKLEDEKGELAEILLLRENGINILPNHIKLLMPETSIDTLSLFNIITYGITVRGTVGIEMSALGIRTITAGTGRYSGLGFTLDPINEIEYETIMLNLNGNNFKMNNQEIKIAKCHAYLIFKKRVWDYSYMKADTNLDLPGSILTINAKLNNINIDISKEVNLFLNFINDKNLNVDYLKK